jgi:3',5'-cyclic AMP phosphodiesterase CpdA
MRTIAQISDLHFGAHEPAVVEQLYLTLNALRPDLIVVSGDLTQRARTEQFLEADAFLSALEGDGFPLVVVPGNHDVPMHKPMARLFWPLSRYRRRIMRNRSCWYADAEVAVLGLASAHGLTIKDGRLTRVQIATIGRAFAESSRQATRILVTHHPLVPLPGDSAGEMEPALRGARATLKAVREADVHLVLAGHHHAHSVGIAGPKLSIDPQVMVVQAGTATSYRRRGTPNSFNLIRLEGPRAVIEEWVSDGGPFSCPEPGRSVLSRSAHGWAAAPAAAMPAGPA